MSRRLPLLVAVVAALAVAGCVGVGDDPGADAADAGPPTDDVPADPTLPAAIAGLETSGTVSTEGSGTGIWIDHDDDLLFSTQGTGGLTIVDVSDPEDPQVLSSFTKQYARDVDVLEQDGYRYAALAASGEGIVLMNATDPTEPEIASTTELPSGAHNLAVVPGTSIVYNSGAGDAIHGIDAADPADPEPFSFPIPETVDGHPVTSNGCHDISPRPDLGLAFCAGGGSRYMQGGGETFVWDIRDDPKDPEWVSLIDDQRIVYHHQAIANAAGDVLVINDEFVGYPPAYVGPNCLREEVGPATVQVPSANAWFVDISDPANPEILSHVSRPTPEEPRQNCGSHFGDVVGDRNKLVMGWYDGGTMLVDFEDPANPSILDIAEPEGSTWDARYHEGHVYTGSGDVQILDIVGEAGS